MTSTRLGSAIASPPQSLRSQPPSAPSRFWHWRGHRIHYVHAAPAEGLGQSRPPLLLVHGFGASTAHWKKNIADLKQDFDVWAIDLLGFGQSDKAHVQYGGAFWSQQLHDFITQVIGRPAVIVGNSIGGYVTLCTAAYFPESVRAIVLLNAAGPFSDDDRHRNQTDPEALNPIQRTIQYLRQDLFRQSWTHGLVFLSMRRRSAIRKTLRQVYANPSEVTEELVEEIYRPACDRGAFGAFSAMFSSPPGEPIDALLRNIGCPLLQLWGTLDPWGYSEPRRQKFQAHYPSQTEIPLQAGHCPHDDAPAAFNEALRGWVLGLE